MTGITYAQLCALSDADQIREERIAIICEGEKCGEEEAIAILDQKQRELFGKYDNAKGNRLRCSLRNPR